MTIFTHNIFKNVRASLLSQLNSELALSSFQQIARNSQLTQREMTKHDKICRWSTRKKSKRQNVQN